jgi:HlyD family secretion protein
MGAAHAVGCHIDKVAGALPGSLLVPAAGAVTMRMRQAGRSLLDTDQASGVLLQMRPAGACPIWAAGVLTCIKFFVAADRTIRGMWRILRNTVIVLAVLAALAYALRNVVLGTPVALEEARRVELVQTVVASGRIATPQRVTVGTVITGRVARIPVAEGQRVRAGEPLIELDAVEERAALARAQANVLQAQARLRQLEELGLPAAEQAVAQAQANVTQLERQHERIRMLQEKGFVGQAQLDEARRNLTVAESQLAAARLQVRSNAPGGSDRALAQAALELSRAEVQSATARLLHTVVSAPVSGVLISRSVEPGDIVQPGRELMVLAPSGETQIWLNVDERNLAQLAVGQKALASADAFPDRRFAAELFYINPGVDRLRGSVEVKLRVPDPPEYLRQDMTVSADIEVARRPSALVVSSEALRDPGTREPWVMLVRNGRAVRQPVATGLRGEGQIEIVSGLAPGDLVIPASEGYVRTGQRVRAASNSALPPS